MLPSRHASRTITPPLHLDLTASDAQQTQLWRPQRQDHPRGDQAAPANGARDAGAGEDACMRCRITTLTRFTLCLQTAICVPHVDVVHAHAHMSTRIYAFG